MRENTSKQQQLVVHNEWIADVTRNIGEWRTKIVAEMNIAIQEVLKYVNSIVTQVLGNQQKSTQEFQEAMKQVSTLFNTTWTTMSRDEEAIKKLAIECATTRDTQAAILQQQQLGIQTTMQAMREITLSIQQQRQLQLQLPPITQNFLVTGGGVPPPQLPPPPRTLTITDASSQ